MRRRHVKVCLLAALLCLLTACVADQEFSSLPCRLAYNNMTHNDATLASAMNEGSRGIFCKIYQSARAGALYLNFENNAGLRSQQPMTAEEKMDWQKGYTILGVNNGIIVGYQTFVTDGPYKGFIAYDAQCPNCMRLNNNYLSPAYPLSMSAAGIATCAKCGKKYDMNNGGIIQNGEEGDKGLEKYVASSTGPFGLITVNRR